MKKIIIIATSRKAEKSYFFLVARTLRGWGDKGLATKKKELFLKL